MRALLLIDLSKDFIHLDGALTCGQPGLDIIPYCTTLVRDFLQRGEPVLDARDEHDAEDVEIASKLFPPHNMRGTDGQALIDELRLELETVPELWHQIFKKHYNAGYQTRLFDLIRTMGIDELHVIGVCTDICVRYTVNGLYEFKTTSYPNLRVVVHSGGVTSFNPVGHADSLAHFALAFGVEVVHGT